MLEAPRVPFGNLQTGVDATIQLWLEEEERAPLNLREEDIF